MAIYSFSNECTYENQKNVTLLLPIKKSKQDNKYYNVNSRKVKNTHFYYTLTVQYDLRSNIYCIYKFKILINQNRRDPVLLVQWTISKLTTTLQIQIYSFLHDHF